MVSLPQRKTPRAQWYDYTSPGGYFVTICTQDREHYFGEVVDGEMMLHELGKYATDHWTKISDHYPMVEPHAFVCMPNHIHGILMINDDVGTQFLASDTRTYKDTSLHRKSGGIQPQSGSLGAIIRGYKIGITKYAKEHNIPFAWQSRYYDHIIRDTRGYDTITHYIRTNPQNRKEDRFYS